MTKQALRALLPWKAPEGWMDDDGADCDVDIDGHRFVVRDSGGAGMDSGRTRWRVSCLTCGEMVHTGSTSATAQIHMHLRDVERANAKESR